MADAQANIGIGIDTTQALAAIRQLQREISAFHTSMAKGGALANAESARLSQNLVNTINAGGKFSASMTNISSSTESFTTALEKNKLSMGQYFRYAGGASRSFGKMFSREFNTINRVATERVKDLQTQYISMGRDANGALQAIKVRPLALDMDNLGTKVQMVAQKQQLFNQLLKQGSTNLLNFGKNTQWAGRQLMVGFTIPLTIFGAAAVREFQKIEEQVVKFKRVYGDMFNTDAETEKALANVRQLAEEFTKYGIAVEKTIGLAAKVAQMGNTGAALEAQVTQATRLAVLGGLEQQEALDTTISLTNAFGIAAEDLAGKIAFLNAAENQTILAIEDFNTAIPLSGSVVKQLGGDVEDLAVLLTAMREGGINASQAGNALKSSLGRLINPSRNAKETLSGFGIDVLGIVDANAGNLMGTINTLAYSLDKLDPLDRARSIEALFGKFQFARMSTMFQNIVKDGSQANKVLQLTTNSTAELAIIAERELKRVEESPAFKLQKQMEKLKAELAPIGAEFVKAILPIVEFGSKILKAFNEMGDGGKQFVVILTALAGVVAPAVLMAFGLVANGVANLIKFFAMLGRGFGMLTGQSKILGTGTEYMTQQQIEAAAVAASLGQSHSHLIQVFSAEAAAVNSLTAAYRQSIIAQGAFSGTGAAASARIPKPRGYAQGGLIRGPGTGTSDSIIAAVSNKEFIVNAAATKENLPLLEALNSGKIKISDLPGFSSGGQPGTESAREAAVRQASRIMTKAPPTGVIERIEKLFRDLPFDQVESALSGLTQSSIDRASELVKATQDLQNARIDQSRPADFAHVGGDTRIKSRDAVGHESFENLTGTQQQTVRDAAKFAPDADIRYTHGYGFDLKGRHNTALSIQNQTSGANPAEVAQDFASRGVDKWDEAVSLGGGDLQNDQELRAEFEAYDAELSSILSGLDAGIEHLVDTLEDKKQLLANNPDLDPSSIGVVEDYEQQASSKLGTRGQQVRQNAKDRVRSIRVNYDTESRQRVVDAAAGGDPDAQRLADSMGLSAGPGGQAVQRKGAKRTFEAPSGKKVVPMPGSGVEQEELANRIEASRQAGYQDAEAWEDGATSANPKDVADISREQAGRNSPHPEAFPDGSDDAKDYLRGQESVLGTQSDPYGKGSPLAPPPPPQVGYMPDNNTPRGKLRMLGKNIVDKVGDSAPGKAAGRFLAKQSGVAVTDSKGEVYYDPNQDMSTWAGQMTAEEEEFKRSLPSGHVADGAPLPVRVVDGFEMDPKFQETMESGQVQTENLNETMAKNKESTDTNSKEISKQDKRQNRGALAGKMMAGLGGLTMAAGMATQVDGVVGETAQRVVGPLAALTGILPTLTALGPVLGSLVAVIGLVAAGFIMYNKAVKDTARETYEFQRAMGSSREAIQSFAEFSGKVTQTELFQKQQEERFNPFNIGAGKSTFGENFAGDEAGQALVENIRTSLVDLGRDQTVSSVFQQLGQAVGEGALSIAEARSIATELGDQIGDMSFGIEVNANLMRLLGPGGEDLTAGDRLTILADLREDRQRSRAEMDLEYRPTTGREQRTPGSEANLERSEIVESLGGGFGGTVAAFFTSGRWHQLSFELNTGIGAAKENMAQLGTILAQGVNDADAYAAEMAAVEATYGESLAKAYAMGDQYEIDRLEAEKTAAQQELIDLRKESQSQVIAELSKDIPKTRIAMKEALAVEFGDDEAALKQYTDALKQIQGLGLEENTSLELEYMLTSGDMPFHTAMAIVENYENMPSVSTKIMEIQTNFGDLSGDASGLFNTFKSIDEELAQQFVLQLDTTDLDEYQKQIEGFGAISRIQGLFPEGEEILLDVALKDPEVLTRILENTAKLEGLENEQITLDFIANTFGEETLAAATTIWEDVPVEDRKSALYSILTALDLDLGEGYDDLFESLKGQTIAGVTINEPGDILSLIGARTTGVAQSNRDLGDGEPETPAGGGGQKENFDELTTKLRDLRLATIDMKRGWDGMQQSLEEVFAGGTKAINVFDGLSNQIRRLGVGEGLIEKIIGMDPDEYEERKKELFVFDEAGNIVGTTNKLKNMNAAMNAIALGEYVNSQQSFIENTNNQFTAMQMLTAQGLSFVEAYEMVQDQALATAIAMGISKQETAELIRITQMMQEMKAKYNKVSEEEQAAKAVKQTNKEFNNRVAVLNKLASQQGKYTDEEINAILNDSNLSTLFLNPKIDSKSLSKALENARRAADLELQIKVSTEEGKKGLFNELVSEVQNEFNRQETAIDIDFRLNTKGDQDIVNEAQNQIAAIQYQVDDYEAQLKGIEDQEEVINEKYDDRYKALEEVAKANERIQRIRSAELDIADALSRGDIAAAARAQQELRTAEAQNRSEAQKEMLQRQQEAEIARVRSASGESRTELEDKIKALQDEIFGIEEDSLEPAQERIRIAEYQKQMQIDALEVSGKTRDEWDQIASLTDIATQNTEEFAKNVERALALYEYFVNGAPLDFSLFGDQIEALREMGVNVEKAIEQKAVAVAEEVVNRPGTTEEDKKSVNAVQEFTKNALIKFTQYGAMQLTELEKTLIGIGTTQKISDLTGPALQKFTSGQSITQEEKFLLGMADSPYAPPSPTPRPKNPAVQNAANNIAPVQATAPLNTPTYSNPATSKTPNIFKPGQGIKKATPVPLGGGLYIYVNKGGIIPKFNAGGRVKGYAAGGLSGKTLGSDNIPAMLTPGEFVVRKRAVQDFGMKNLEAINSGEYSGGSVYNYNLAVNVKSDADPDRIARTVMKQIQRVDSQKVRGNRL